MSPDSLIVLLSAAGVLLVAHAVRALRWALLFPASYLTSRFNLFLGLSIGYAVNVVAPLRLGELVRAAFVRQREGIRFSYVAATIIVERVLDLAAVSIISVAVAIMVPSSATVLLASSAVMAGATVAVFAAAMLLRRSPKTRRLLWTCASLFNDRIKFGLVDLLWSTGDILLSGSLLRWRFLTISMVMWALYLAAYACFAGASDATVFEVFHVMLLAPLLSLTASVAREEDLRSHIALLAFAIGPVVLVVLYGLVKQWRMFTDMAKLAVRFGRSGRGALSAAGDRFEAKTSYARFLAALFSGDDVMVTGFGIEAINDCTVRKFFQGGSDAIVALVEIDRRLIVRKFASGPAADKLKVQRQWLGRHGNSGLPLVTVLSDREAPHNFSYDMPMLAPSGDFYEAIHTSSVQENQDLLFRLVGHIAAFHDRWQGSEANREVVDAYFRTKGRANARAILDFVRPMIGEGTVTINDTPYEISEWDSFSDRNWTATQIRDRRTAVIHGDLTVENVIVAPKEPLGFFLIDPNPENIFNSPLIDWAKLMQSLHLGYETLNRGMSCTLADGAVRIIIPRSQAYATLHAMLEAELSRRIGQDGLREVYFHELVNYLRLTVYKMRQNRMRGLGFFACTTILLRRYRERWEERGTVQRLKEEIGVTG